jgi:L,D-transpeptidase YcbB
MRLVSRAALGLIITAYVSLPALAAEPDGPAALITRSEAVRVTIRDRLLAKVSANSARRSQQGALVEYYSIPTNQLLWVDADGLTEHAKSVIEEIGQADNYGLRSADYELPKPDGFNANDGGAIKWLTDAEIKISLAVLGYARDARGGRIEPSRLTDNLDPTLSLPQPSEVLETIAIRSNPATYLRSFQPDQPQFEALRQKLIETKGGPRTPKPSVTIPDGPVLKKRVEHEQVALLRKRLEVPSDAAANETLFDDSVDEAVKRFQRAQGVAPDGLVGAGMRRLLNEQPHAQTAVNSAKLSLILLNMERWRWLPQDLGPYYVNVNVPEFMLRVVDEGKVVHTARVVVGKPDKQTPIFSQDMQEVIFNPYWNVPNSIKTEELLPYLTQGGGLFGGGWDTSILERHNLRINYGGREVSPASLDWGRIDIRSLDIYQPPGPNNVLGNVKFVFPNKHDVYMHDTTQKNLFAKSVRAESHGCMRVQDPDQLALTLLGHDQGWTAGRVASAIQTGYDQHVALNHRIPVYITYFTTWVNEDGSLATFGDVYGHDARMAAALFGRSAALRTPTEDNELVANQWKPSGKRARQSSVPSEGITRALFGF